MKQEKPYHVPKDTLFPVKFKKKTQTYTIREDILKQFNDYTESNNLQKTGVIETLMVVFLENVGVREKST